MVDEIYYDPYDFDIDVDPYPVWKRLRDEAPLYYNEKYDFFAVSRFDDVERCSVDWRTYLSGKGSVLEMIKQGIEIPPGSILFEDPPTHDVHRSLLSRVFTPRRIAELEPKVRAFCANSLDPAGGERRVRLHRRPGRADADAHHRHAARDPRGGPGGDPRPDRRGHAAEGRRAARPERVRSTVTSGDAFADYIDWRAEHPSDDLMTELLTAEFEDHTGVAARCAARRSSGYVGLLAGAGNETTTRLIGWTGKVLAENPDQRRELVEDRSLVPNAIEELLRYEAPSPVQARYITKDVEHHGQTVASRQRDGAAHRGRQPRRAPLPRSRPLRHHARHRPPPVVRVRDPLLPRSRAGAARGSRGARRGAERASPSGRSTGNAPSRRTPARVRGWEKLPVTTP